ncbi:MAG: 50S ribosomal protein L9 [Actinobacteria bacterium]|jgi:large subunit ribosomal protein L9|nr:50S ribosomal protein L9 [Actinomycetota bacterium]
MKLILTQDVSGLGAPGDVVEVKDGYGRNFLLPRGLATPWTKGGEKQVAQIKRAREVREVRDLDAAQAIKASLEGLKVKVPARAGDTGRLFGAITVSDVVSAVEAAGGPAVDKRKVTIVSPIKTTGSHKVEVRVHPEVLANLTVDVVSA